MKKIIKKISSNKKANIMLLILFTLFFSYSYAIASTTFSISKSEIIHQDIQNLQNEIAELEFTFF